MKLEKKQQGSKRGDNLPGARVPVAAVTTRLQAHLPQNPPLRTSLWLLVLIPKQGLVKEMREEKRNSDFNIRVGPYTKNQKQAKEILSGLSDQGQEIFCQSSPIS